MKNIINKLGASLVRKTSVKKYILTVAYKDTCTIDCYEFEDLNSATAIMNNLKDKVGTAYIDEVYDSCTTRTINKQKVASL